MKPIVSHVGVLLIMRFCQKVMEYQFIGLAASSSNGSTATEGVSETNTPMSWMYSCRYLLPVLGGLVGCWLGHVPTLQLGAIALLASTAAMTGAVYTDQWLPDSGLALFACALMLVYNGLAIPNIMHAVLLKRTRPQRRTVLCALIYMSSAAGLLAAIHVNGLLDNPSVGKHCGLVWMAFALMFALLAFFAVPYLDAATPTAPVSEPLEAPLHLLRQVCSCTNVRLPTHSRLQRSCLVFGLLIPFLIGLCDDRSTAFNAHQAFVPKMVNITNGGEYQVSGLPVGALLAVALVFVNGAFVVLACCQNRRRRLPVQPRLLAGIVLEVILEVVLAAVSGVVVIHPVAMSVVYTCATLVDATSAALTMVAAYELMDSFERDSAKPLIVGVMLTVWGLANLAGRFLVMICHRLPPSNPVLRPSVDQPPLLFVYHSLLLLLLLLSLAFWRLFGLRVARSLQIVYEDEEELQRLLEVNAFVPNADADNEDQDKPLQDHRD